MKNVISAVRFWRDQRGASMIEFTLVFPLLMLMSFGTVDMSLILWDWAQANKAAQRGARVAVVANPIPSGITSPEWVADYIGDSCIDPLTGADLGTCAAAQTTCTPAAENGSCTNGYNWDEAAFMAILQQMQTVYPRLDRQNVQFSYRTNGLGFVGRPGGLPFEVTVEIRCLTNEVYFLVALAGWAFVDLPPECPAGPAGPRVPRYATTLTSEALGFIN